MGVRPKWTFQGHQSNPDFSSDQSGNGGRNDAERAIRDALGLLWIRDDWYLHWVHWSEG